METIASGLSTANGPKFRIQQSVPSGNIKRGPYAIMRSADLNDGIEIKRRFGEGAKPLFERDDITVNQTNNDKSNVPSDYDKSGCKSQLSRESSSTESSSPERYRHRDNKRKFSPTRHKSSGKPIQTNCDKIACNSKLSYSKTSKNRRRNRSKSRSISPIRKKSREKVPYYRDEIRERDRLKRLYGYSSSRSPPSSSCNTVTKRRVENSPRKRRSLSRERYRKRSPYHTCRRDNRSHRSRTPPRTHSPQRQERHRHSIRSTKDDDKKPKGDMNSLPIPFIPATPQYIPIPVAVPADYAAYSFPGWTAPQPPWHHSPQRPPPTTHFASYPMWPMMPPIRQPHQTPFTGVPQPFTGVSPPFTPYGPHVVQKFPSSKHNTNNCTTRPKKSS